MKRKFSVHLDAMVIVSILFAAILALAIFQQSQVSALTIENQALQWQGVEDSFNLSSKEDYIKKLESKLEASEKPN